MKLSFQENEFKEIVKQSQSMNDVCRFYKKPINGYYHKLFLKWVVVFGCDISHFERNVELVCNHCNKKFCVAKHDNDKRKFCSVKCANQKVRGKALPVSDEQLIGNKKHRNICFRYHQKQCIICKVTEPITVHHYDENHDNDKPENLVPMCANHHILLHTNGFKDDIQPKVDEYVRIFMVNRAK
jgi:hypothetical protein